MTTDGFDQLARVAATWHPDAVSAIDQIGAWTAAAGCALFDLDDRPARPGAELWPLWHWLYFLDHPRQDELGADGHPENGHFLPPIPDRRRMIAGGRLRLQAPIHFGDTIERRSTLVAATAKSGRSGELLFVVIRHEFRRGTDLLLVEEQDVVYRSQPAGQPRGAAAEPATPEPPAPEPAAPADWQLTLATTPQLLFRFSALTYNTHRIHYDQPYVTAVEGYPGLVVHGPLLALLMLELPRRKAPGRTVREFDYRLLRPVFSGAEVIASGRPGGSGDDSVRLEVRSADGPVAATGRVRLGPG